MLELPFLPNDAATVRMVNELNAWELSGADLPPHLARGASAAVCPPMLVSCRRSIVFRGSSRT
jgi:hypothetical protein